MHITKNLVPEKERKPLYDDIMTLPFGETFTDHMFIMKYSPEKEWHDPRILPYGNLALDPAAVVLHYAQEVFEGQKAYKSPAGEILLFRPWENARRLNKSLARMCMPLLPEGLFLEAEDALLREEARWVPSQRGASLYVRAAVIATEPAIGIRASRSYLFFIICSPVGPYFKDFAPIRVKISSAYVRAVDGGTGEAKTGGNYAASLLATMEAKKEGYSQVIWLDGRRKRFIEEMGGMNIFFVRGKTLLTPPLTGTILHGITRKSIIEMAGSRGLRVQETRLDVDDVMRMISRKEITEAFACGTAAVISPIGAIAYEGKEFTVSEKTGPVTQGLYTELTAIQYGVTPDPRGWVYTVNP
ncbi:branched-chain amino acid aminotransferase [Candidatus Mcinerneyibacteriota bacterium]|nr:branched-chain amino acid aminotransferase [Candidatus Mcinerneyibacteriota bacterium]